MNRILPPLVALRAFDTVGRTGSIRAASEELRVSHTVVSRHVRNLEARVGVKLFETNGRRLAMTLDGKRFHSQIASAFDLIGQATAQLRNGADRSLSIWCIPGLANCLLLPRLTALQAQLPNWQIELQPTLERADLLRGVADAEIVYLSDACESTGLSTRLLATPRVFPVASPTFIARYPRIGRPDDLLHVPLIHEESFAQWTQWLARAGCDAAVAHRGPRLWHAHLTLEAARLGQGVALTNELLAREDLVAGTLVELTSSDVRLGAYYLIVSTARAGTTEIEALHDYLSELFGTMRQTD